jgi:hypothetical protein
VIIFDERIKEMEIENLDIKKQFLKSLNERQRRQYLGQMALDLGHGGIKMICETFSINPVSVRIGIKELKENEELPFGKVRKTGGGRKKNSVGT